MELQISGINIELTPVIQRYVERKLGKLTRHLSGIIESKVEITEEKTKSPQQHYLVRVTVDSGVGGAVFHGEERGEDLFKAVDKVTAVMLRQLERHKGKVYDKGRGTSMARGSGISETSGQSDSGRRIVKTKRFVIEPMSVDEAVRQMESLRHNFFLFLDADSEEMKLLYRRNDGEYGLIEPEIG